MPSSSELDSWMGLGEALEKMVGERAGSMKQRISTSTALPPASSTARTPLSRHLSDSEQDDLDTEKQIATLDRGSAEETGREGLIGQPVPGLKPHRISTADGTTIEAPPVVVEANALLTSQDYGYDRSLQPRQRDRAASQAQVRDIATNLDPERLAGRPATPSKPRICT